ncbi:MAG: lactate utilization protein C [Pirellulaceae bacterium]
MADASRNEILQSLRRVPVDRVELPDLDQPWTQYEDPLQQFIDTTQAVGGKALRVRSTDEMNAAIEKIPTFGEAKKIGSLVDGVRGTNVDLEAIADPHDLEDLDFLIASGEFGVAENGAIWVTDRAVRHRVSYFITQHLALVVPSDQIVSNLNEAYQRLEFQEAGFGLFLSGPSKTADIEQSLVIGAHGARSLTVFCVG